MPTIPQTAAETPPPDANASQADAVTVSPFYHSAVNAVTQPNSATWCSNYFIDRWMPILGNDGTRIVLALRRHGYNNRRTGVKREEIKIDREGLAAIVGCSGDTITRELGTNKKTGKLQNPWLHQFVRKFEHKRKDARTGQIRQEVNGYWVAMDDPVHPDDWHLVAEYVMEQEAIKEKGQKPGGQNASPVPTPETQNASSASQNASGPPQNASGRTQNASRNNELIPDSYSPLGTLDTPAAPGGSLSLFEEGSRGEIVRERSEEPEPAWKIAYNTLPDGERRAWTARASAEARSHGVKPSNIPEVVKIARALFRAEFERTGQVPL